MVTTKAMAKVAAVATGLAMATSVLSLAPMAHAATLTNAQVQSILSLLTSFGADASTIANVQASLTGGTPTVTTGGSCNVGSNDLTTGSTGSAVMALQAALIANGYSIPAGATGYFGAQTQAAVMAWQKAAGISPAAGYFGPISRAAFNLCTGGSTGTPGTGAPPTTTPSSPLEGENGSISDVTELGQYSNEEVAEGNSGVKILGAEVEASNDGDIELRSVKVSFDPSGNTGSDNLDNYLDTVTIMLDDEEVGSADVDDFTQDSSDIWTRTISLDGAIIRADDTAKLYISVDAVSNIDTGDIAADSWEVDIENIRFMDGGGVTTTETGFDIDGMNVPIAFVSFSTSADTELKISLASGSPDSGLVEVDSSSNTDNVLLLKGTLRLDGDSDVVLDEFPVTFTSGSETGTSDGVDDVTGSVTLKVGSEEFTETVTLTSALTGTVTFDNLDFNIDAGDTVNFEVLADINDLDGTIFAEGDTLTASVTASNRNSMDVENTEGDQLADATEKSGTATGEAQEFRTSGAKLIFVSATTDVTSNSSANDDLGTFVIKFKVRAIGDTVYVSSLADATLTGVTAGKTSVHPNRAGTATVGGTSVRIENKGTGPDTATLNGTGLWIISDGNEQTFEVTTTMQLPSAGTAGLYQVELGGVSWDTDVADATPDNAYTLNLDAFETSSIGLN